MMGPDTPARPKRRRKPVPQDNTPDLDLIIEQLGTAKIQKAQAEKDEAKYTQMVLAELNKLGVDRHTTPHGVTGKAVHSTRSDLDEQKLKKALGAQLWRRVTVEKVDKKLLESNIAAGTIDGVVVSSCMEEYPIKPYVLITRKSG